jgi:predicted NAD/FAD-dependent oxidoreductase
MYNDENAYQKTTGGAKDSTQVTDIKSSLNLMGGLGSVIDQYKSVLGPITGRARGINPYDVTAQDFQARMTAVAQVVGKAMEGGVLRKEDTIKYRKILPQITDTPAVAKAKIQNVIELLNQQLSSRTNESSIDTSLPDIVESTGEG